MAGTYPQLYIQIVFAVKDRENLIKKEWKDELQKYMSGIIMGKGQKSIMVNGGEVHNHCFVGIKPAMSISDLVRGIKNNSSKYVNPNAWIKGKFRWQEGLG